jgi:hypothetical protein
VIFDSNPDVDEAIRRLTINLRADIERSHKRTNRALWVCLIALIGAFVRAVFLEMPYVMAFTLISIVAAVYGLFHSRRMPIF